MSKIGDLINKLCANGVEYKNLGEICNNIVTGKLNANAMVQNGEYPFFTCDAKPFRIDTYHFDTEAILVSGNGSQVGHINYYKGKFNAYQRTYVLFDFVNNVNILFIFFYAKAFLRSYILLHSKKGSVPYITLPMLQEFSIPIPPVEVQEEIVRILNTFTALGEELEAELEARKKQYEYYRNKLLNFEGKNVEWKTLGEVCLPTENIKWKDNRNKEFHYIDLSSVNRNTNTISDAKIINSETAPSRAQQIVKVDDVLFGTTRPTLKRYTIINQNFNNQICSTGFCILRANKEFLLPKFLFYILTTANFYNYIDLNQEGAGYPSISNNTVKKYILPIPTLSEQKRIVEILDKFDTLINDLSIGIPAEIETRRKQYEYYRGKLLSFKKLDK